MKTCTKCKITKDLDEFFVRDKATGRIHSQCKACYRLHRQFYSVEHYKKYGDAYRLRAKIRRAKIRSALQIEMLAYLSDKKCMICGEDDIRTLEFDHIDPSLKSFNIAKGITDGRKWEEIMIEIKKCRILCANCHKKHTSTQKQWYKQPK